MKKNDTADLIRDILKKYPRGLNIRQLAEMCRMNRMSVAKYLGVMTANGIVEVQSVGNARVYFLSRQIPVTTYMEYTSRHYCITDSRLNVVQLNEWIPETVGMKYEDFIGHPLLDVLNGVVVNLDDCRIAMEKALAGEANTIVVEENFRGKHLFFEMLHMPVQFPDGSHGMMAVSQNITDKKKLEIALREEGLRYQDMVEHIPAIVFSADAAGVLTYLSPRAAACGFVPDKLVGRAFGELAIPEDREAVMAGLMSVRESGRFREIRFRAACPDAQAVWMEADGIARQTVTGALYGITGFLRDIPEEAGVMQSKKEARRA
jgi:PAS domain S-box-containing protein